MNRHGNIGLPSLDTNNTMTRCGTRGGIDNETNKKGQTIRITNCVCEQTTKSGIKTRRLSMSCPFYMRDTFIFLTQFAALDDMLSLNKINVDWYKFTRLYGGEYFPFMDMSRKTAEFEDENIYPNEYTLGCQQYRNIIFNMFCNLDILYQNPIENGTNLLHNTYSNCEWFNNSFKYFNQNLLLILCNNFDKYTFLNEAFPYIAQKCCQYMINYHYSNHYNITPFDGIYNFYHSSKKIEAKTTEFSKFTHLLFNKSLVRNYESNAYYAKKFTSKFSNVYYFCEFYFHVKSLVNKLKQSTTSNPHLQNGVEYKTNERSVVFAKLFDCFNFWNVVANSASVIPKHARKDKNIRQTAIGSRVIFDMDCIEKKMQDNVKPPYSLFVNETMLKLLCVLFANDLDDGKQTVKKNDGKKAVYIWDDFMQCLLYHQRAHIQQIEFPFEILVWSRDPGVFDCGDLCGKIEDSSEFGYELMCTRTMIRNILFDRTSHDWHKTISLFHNGIVLCMAFYSNQRLGDSKLNNLEMFPHKNCKQIVNRRNYGHAAGLMSFVQNRLRYKGFIVCEYLLVYKNCAKKYIDKRLIHSQWKQYCSLIYKPDVLNHIVGMNTIKQIVYHTISTRKYVNSKTKTQRKNNQMYLERWLTRDEWNLRRSSDA